VKNGLIHGSVSAFEQYFNCPYSYFLARGLKVRAPETLLFKANTIGSALHQVMAEISAKQQHDPQAYDDEQKLRELVEASCQYRELYCFQQEYFTMVVDFLVQQTKIARQAYRLIDGGTRFKPTYFEYEVRNFIIECEQVRLSFSAYIDRIDVYEGWAVVKDYKTGSKSFNLHEFISGLSLQLLTYMMMVEESLKLRPLGNYYLPLINPIINRSFYKLGTRDGLRSLTSEDALSGVFDYHGLILSDDEKLVRAFNPERRGIVGIKGQKIDSYDYRELKNAIHKIYDDLAKELLEGKISISPYEGACRYCDYPSVCQFKGRAKKIKKHYYRSDGEELKKQDLINAFNKGELKS